MWLPKDERRLLESYYLIIGCDLTSQYLNKQALARLIESCRINAGAKEIKASSLNSNPAPNDDRLDQNDPVSDMKRWLDRKSKIETSNDLLKQRGLINILDDQTSVVKIGLTIQGYDLGFKYSHWFSRTGLWFAEYKHHWIWLVVSFLGGILGGVLVNWLSR
jgi:hypothetical protein